MRKLAEDGQLAAEEVYVVYQELPEQHGLLDGFVDERGQGLALPHGGGRRWLLLLLLLLRGGRHGEAIKTGVWWTWTTTCRDREGIAAVTRGTVGGYLTARRRFETEATGS